MTTIENEPQTEELIEVVQLPVIQERLNIISEQIKAAVSYVKSLECNEDTYKLVKKQKAELNKQFEKLDAQRKAVKKAVLEPYNEFEEIYNSLIRDVFKPAEREISKQITDVENGLKLKKRAELVEYFEEYTKAIGIDFVSFEDIPLNITLSASVKSLKKQIRDFLDKTITDLSLIATQDHATEILVEYRRTLDASYSIMAVKERHRAIEEEERRHEDVKATDEAKQAVVSKVEEAIEETEAFAPPTVEEAVQEENEAVYETTFKVRGTLTQLKALKKFLINGGYDYE